MNVDKGKSKTKGIRIAVRVLVVATALFVPVFLFVVVPDQIRPLRPIPPTTPLRIVKRNQSNGEAATIFVAALPTSTSLHAVVPPNHSDSRTTDSALERLAGELTPLVRPIADTETLPEDLRSVAQDWNDAVDRTAVDLLDLLARPDGQDRREIIDRMDRLMHEYLDAQRAFRAKAEAMGAEGLRVLDDTKPERLAAFQSWYQLYTLAGMAVYRHNKEWLGAAACCQVLGHFEPAGEPGYWWDQEQVFLRNGGIEGRFELAGRSIQKAYGRWAVGNPEAHETLRHWGLNP